MHEAFAARAGQPGPDDAVHDKPTGDVFQFLGHILTDPTQAPAAIGTGICARRQFDLHPGDVVGIGRRFGLSLSSMSGSFIRAVMAAAAISLVSSAS